MKVQLIIFLIAIFYGVKSIADLNTYSYDQYRKDFSKREILNQQEYLERKSLFEKRVKEIKENNQDGKLWIQFSIQ